MKVLFELVVSDVNVAKELERQKALVKELTKELKGVDEAAEGYEALVGQLAAAKVQVSDLTQQQKALNNEFKQTQVPKDSLAGLRLEYSALVQQITNLSKAERESETGKALISQAAGLKQEINGIQESVGNFTGSVGDYRNAIGDAFASLGNLGGGFAEQAGILSSALGVLDQAKAAADKFFSGIKSSASAASEAAKSAFEGIGDFAASAKESFGELFNPTELKEGGDAVLKVGENAKATGDSLKGAGDGAGLFSRGLGTMKAGLASLGIGLVIAAVTFLIAAFQKFAPVIEFVERAVAGLSAAFDTMLVAAKGIGQGLVSIFSGDFSKGFDEISGSVDGLGEKMKTAAVEGARLKQVLQDLEDAAKVLEVTVAQRNAEVAQLEVQLKNRTKDVQSRLTIAGQIKELENQTLADRQAHNQKLIDVEVDRIANRKELTDAEIFLLKQGGDEAIALATRLEDAGKLQLQAGGSEVDNLQKLALEKIRIQQESTQTLERAQNREDAIRDKAAEDAQKRREKENAAAEKQAKALEEQLRRIAEIRKEISGIKNEGQSNDFERQLGAVEIARADALAKIEAARLSLETKVKGQGGKRTEEDAEELALIEKQTDLVTAAFDEQAQKIREARARAAEKQFDDLQKLQAEVSKITVQNAQEGAAAEFQQVNDGFESQLDAAKKRFIERNAALREAQASGDISSSGFRRETLKAATELAKETLRIEKDRAAAEVSLIANVRDTRIAAAGAVLEAQRLAIEQTLEAEIEAARERATLEGGDAAVAVEELRKKAAQERIAAEREYSAEVGEATRTAEQAQLQAIETVDAAAQESHDKEVERLEEQKKLRKQIAAEVLDLAGDISDSLLEIEKNRAEQATDAQLTALDREKEARLKKAGTNQAAIQKIEADYEKKKLAIEQDAAKKRKEIALKSALIDAALAIIKTLASVPFPANVIAAASIGIATAFQIAAIQSQKFERGGFVKFGMFGGKPHSAGGTKGYFEDGTRVEVEQDELFAVVSKKNTRLLQMLSELNALGGEGYKFAAGGSIDFTPNFAMPNAAGGSGQVFVVAAFTDEQISELAARVADENAASTKAAIGEGLSDSSRRLEREAQLEKNRSF